jgi:broad specificity phosphatase PhoE
MDIILLRHGQPNIDTDKLQRTHEMRAWIDHYNLAGIADTPPENARSLASQPRYVVASTLPRALASLALLGLQPHESDALFCEAELPVFPVPLLRLRPLHWVVIFRLLWLCGYAKNVESLSSAKKRAAAASGKLADLAATQGAVLLLGHGVMNSLIANKLKKAGWRLHSQSGNSYWNARVYRLADPLTTSA